MNSSLDSFYLFVHFTLLGAFGIVLGATISKGWDCEAVAVMSVTGESLLT